MIEFFKVLIGAIAFVNFFAFVWYLFSFRFGKSFRHLGTSVLFAALGAVLFGGLGADNPPAPNQTAIVSAS